MAHLCLQEPSISWRGAFMGAASWAGCRQIPRGKFAEQLGRAGKVGGFGDR
jgi:hypothetical protein